MPHYNPMTSVRRPRVRFSETSEMMLVTNLSNGPNKRNIWFTQDELDVFKANRTTYIAMVRFHISKQHTLTASSILGLEKFLTAQLTGEYEFQRRTLAKAVLNETQRQRILAARDVPRDELADQLALVAAENSRWTRERARLAALFLEQDQEIRD